jgi:DNA-binding transcriptional LysR family regulator
MDAQLSHADLRYFCEVAQAGNISRAAERLGISQPSLSTAVQRLEKRFGCDLLLRSRTGVELTREGRLLVSRASALLLEWERLESAVKKQADEPTGAWRLGCHITVGLNWLPSVVPSLMRRWPQLELELVHDLSRHITEEVVSHQLDFGIVVNPVRHPDLVIKELSSDVFTLWGNSARLESTVLYDPELLQARQVLSALEKTGVQFERKITSSSLEVLAHLAVEGAGTAIIPMHLAHRMRPRLRRPRGTWPEFRDSVCLIYRADVQRSAAAKALAEALRHARPVA